MKSHELAKKLLNGPDVTVFYHGSKDSLCNIYEFKEVLANSNDFVTWPMSVTEIEWSGVKIEDLEKGIVLQ